jgi:hypothetical protein
MCAQKTPSFAVTESAAEHTPPKQLARLKFHRFGTLMTLFGDVI